MFKFLSAPAFVAVIAISVAAQLPPPPSSSARLQKLSLSLAAKLDSTPSARITQEDRGKAYSKFLEGQRFFWLLGNSRKNRTQAAYQANVKASREALIGSLELDPYVGEAYTMLSELAISSPPNDIDEALELANLAVRVEKNNFGSRRIIARLLTYKSGLNTGKLDPVLTPSAVEAWKYLVGIDPRNAEAWAFLSIFYEKMGKPAERVEALRKWVAATPPLESQFFQRVTGGGESLAPESASLKLAEALIADAKTAEAMDILSQLISDDPDNSQALDMLREAAMESKGAGSAAAVRALRQAVFANPGNMSLVSLLAELYADGGKVAEGAKVLSEAAEKASEPSAAAMLMLLLGDLYERSGEHIQAIGAYEKALKFRGLSDARVISDDERPFVTQVFQRMVRSAKAGGRIAEVQSILERARKVLGQDDDFADRELISIYRESGKRQEALTLVGALRKKNPREESLARLEATLLTELGRVDEGVAGFRGYIAERSKAAPEVRTGTAVAPVTSTTDLAPVDEFSSFLFISQLYTQANRTKDAIASANQALGVARGAERQQIARLTLASAQQMGGDHSGAETTLREILKESPNNPIALNNLGYFLLERNERIEEALRMIQEAVNVDPTNPSYLDSLGWAYFKLGRLEDAEKRLKEAAKFDSLSSTIAEHLGDVYLKQGKRDEALRQWRRALELASEKADVERIKGKIK